MNPETKKLNEAYFKWRLIADETIDLIDHIDEVFINGIQRANMYNTMQAIGDATAEWKSKLKKLAGDLKAE